MNNHQSSSFAITFFKEIDLRLVKESWPRLEQCLMECDEKLLWYRPNEHTNSIGNLVLHLEGNVRQWLLHGVGGGADSRERSSEFISNQHYTVKELLIRMTALKSEVKKLLLHAQSLDLLEPKKIQIYETTVMGALIHVTEHFSYHVGQITFLIKWQKEKDMGYYKGFDLS